MWHEITLPPELLAQLATVCATAVASGVISSARYVFYSATQRRRQSLLARCFSAVSVGLAGGVIGSALAAVLYMPDRPLRSFGVATVFSMLIDPTNLAATKAYLVALVRAFASIQLPSDGAPEPIRDSSETCEPRHGSSSPSERELSDRADSPEGQP